MQQSYDQLRAALLERVDVDVDENAKLVSGGCAIMCPNGEASCDCGETCCPGSFPKGYGCCPYPNAVCCPGPWCCKEGSICVEVNGHPMCLTYIGDTSSMSPATMMA